MIFDPKTYARYKQLAVDGYMYWDRDVKVYRLTDKGMAVLLSCADRPVQVDKLAKPSLAFERLQTDINHARDQSR